MVTSPEEVIEIILAVKGYILVLELELTPTAIISVELLEVFFFLVTGS